MGLKVLVYAPHTQHHCTWRSPWLWAACCLPKPQPGHLASLNRLMWETETFGRVGEDGKEAKGTLLQTKSGDTLWDVVLDDRGNAAWGIRDHGRLGQGHPGRAAAEGYPCCNTGKEVRGKEQHAEAIMLWPPECSPPNSLLKDLGGTEHIIQKKWRDAETEGENRGACLKLNLGEGEENCFFSYLLNYSNFFFL